MAELAGCVASGDVVVHVPDAAGNFVRSQVALREGARLGAAVSSVFEVDVVANLVGTSWSLDCSFLLFFRAS